MPLAGLDTRQEAETYTQRADRRARYYAFIIQRYSYKDISSRTPSNSLCMTASCAGLRDCISSWNGRGRLLKPFENAKISTGMGSPVEGLVAGLMLKAQINRDMLINVSVSPFPRIINNAHFRNRLLFASH